MLFCERRKIEMLAIFPLINLVVLIAILLVILLRKPASAPEDARLAQLLSADIPGALARAETRGQALDQHLRAELAQLRADSAASSAALRTEVLGNINTLGETLRTGMDAQLSGLTQRFTAFTADSPMENPA